jgi:hypothetical protein
MRRRILISPSLPVMLLGLAAICACGGGGGGSGGDAGEDPGTGNNDTWMTDPPPVDPDGLDPIDTTVPDHLLGDGTPGGVTEAQLQSALDAGGVIAFDTGGLPATLHLTSRLHVPPFTAVVLDGGSLVTLDGGEVSGILEKGYLSEVTVQRLRFTGARSAESGAAIDTIDWDGRLTVIDCEFENCRTTDAGPDVGGGAIRALGQRHFQLSGCRFVDCAASNGGALNSLGSRLTILDSSFENCTAFGTGGGADQGSSGQGGIGGAIYIDGVDQNSDESTLRIDGCSFISSRANDHGGAVFAYLRAGTQSTALFNACDFHGNAVIDPAAAVGVGGAIYIQNGDVTVASCAFTENEAVGNGGAIWMIPDQVSRIANSTFHANQAGVVGGAIDIGRGTVYLSSLTIAANHAGLFGGGIRTCPAPDVWIKNTILLDNTGTDPWNGHNVSHELRDGGGNMQWPVRRAVGGEDDTKATPSIIFDDPMLGLPAWNGGPTPTMGFGSGSSAADAGTNRDCSRRDQRGYDRVDSCDIGAFEKQ